MKKKKTLAALGVVCLVASLTLAAPSASADHNGTYNIQIGARLPGGAESMRFFPSSLKVHEGDQLHYTSGGFHTATLLPVGESAQDWVDANASTQDQPFSHYRFDPDDGVGDLKENVDALIQNRDDCGPFTGGTPCDFDGVTVLNSGVAFEGPLDFTAIVNAPAGNSFWVVCLIHPHMRMKVTVVPDLDPTTTQGEIDANRSAKIAQDTDAALALDAKYEAKQTKHRTRSGRMVWDVWQGVDSHWVSLPETYPKRLNIKKGQRVRWHFDQLIYETHSATFPLDEQRWFADIETFNLVCDPDGDGGPGPDTPGDEQDPEICPGGISEVEVDFEAKSAQGTGDGVVNNQGLQNSGIRGVGTQSFESYDVKFAKKSGRKPYTFFCFFHGPKMFTRVNVR